uniref:Uncharacterized protein n=1 Tax=Trypanosoma congolense (strain IL3000) TaxID=1068625 RepID=G0UPR3_TRYCI|nr:conserved hypothetical protein [Trypanosoma congolense IL3000]
MLQKAGRHSGYSTQFWLKPRTSYRTRRDVLTAHSVKSLQRRLVLPLENGDWSRALEVLGARYALLGRATLDYQRVIRGIAGDNASPTRVQSGVRLLNSLRDEIYATDMAADSVWVTLLWAYVQLRRPIEGYECLLQAKRRVRLSPLTWHYMGETLLPLLAELGMLAETKYVLENFMQVGGSRIERERVAVLVAEAAARSGSWVDAVGALGKNSDCSSFEEFNTNVPPPGTRTLSSLFAAVAVDSEHCSSHMSDGKGPREDEKKKFSAEALRSMMCAMADDGQWALALKCLYELQERQRIFTQGSSQAVASSSTSAEVVTHTPTSKGHEGDSSHSVRLTDGEISRLLNALGSQQRWTEAVNLFSRYYLIEGSIPYVHEGQPLKPLTVNLLFSSFPREWKEFVLTDPLKGVRSPQARVKEDELQGAGHMGSSPLVVQLSVMHHPQQIVALLDRILFERDDAVITDCVMATVGPALLQVDQWDRALHLLGQAPCLSRTRVKEQNEQVESKETRRRIREQLVALLLYVCSEVSSEAACYTLLHFPHVFPPEVFHSLPPPEEIASRMRQGCDGKIEERRKYRRFSSQRSSCIVQHTEQMDNELKQRLTSLHENGSNVFRVGVDPDRDPRPPPKGLHDKANGWNFFGRGGEMVFTNHKRTAHPFTMHPKVMRSLADPYRGWGLRQNSCWAHRERVKKWNGHSAV